MSLSQEHSRAFEEAYRLSGAVISIDSTKCIRAVVPYDFDTERERDEDGIQQTVTNTNITCRTADLPTLRYTSTVTLADVVYRVIGTAAEGFICTRLTLETP